MTTEDYFRLITLSILQLPNMCEGSWITVVPPHTTNTNDRDPKPLAACVPGYGAYLTTRSSHRITCQQSLCTHIAEPEGSICIMDCSSPISVHQPKCASRRIICTDALSCTVLILVLFSLPSRSYAVLLSFHHVHPDYPCNTSTGYE